MNSLFNNDTLASIEGRINSISEKSERQWGSMNPGQMLWHCKAPLKLAMKDEKTNLKVNPIKRFVFSFFKASLYNDTPWKQGLPAPKSFMASKEYNLEEEKKQLLELTQKFHQCKNQQEWPPHPLFGKFTREQWGQMQFKHLDHHLRQFGA